MTTRLLTGYTKVTALVLSLCMCVVFFTGCNANNDEIYKAADGFLSAAKDGKMDKISSYASDEVLTDLGWDEATLSGYASQILAAITSNSEVSKDELLENEEIKAAIDELVDSINNNRITAYSIDKDSVSEKNKKGYVTAKVTVQTQSAIEESISGDDIRAEVEQKVYDYMTANMDSLEEYIDSGDMTTLYANIMTAILPDVLVLIQDRIGEVKGEEQTWKLTCTQERKKWIVSEVKIDE